MVLVEPKAIFKFPITVRRAPVTVHAFEIFNTFFQHFTLRATLCLYPV